MGEDEIEFGSMILGEREGGEDLGRESSGLDLGPVPLAGGVGVPVVAFGGGVAEDRPTRPDTDTGDADTSSILTACASVVVVAIFDFFASLWFVVASPLVSTSL